MTNRNSTMRPGRMAAIIVAANMLMHCTWAQSTADGVRSSGVSAEALLDEGHTDAAKNAIDAALARDPRDISALYQLARYLLKQAGTLDSSLLGYRYSDQGADAAQKILQQIISMVPTHGEAHSLLGHIYAVQGDVTKAEKAFKDAEASKQDVPWLRFNQAQWWAQKKQYAQANQLLQAITNERPAKSDRAANSRYNAAWELRQKIAVIEPSLDWNQPVKSGAARRVLAKDFDAFIRGYQAEKPILVHFSSEDSWCAPCAKSNQQIATVAMQYRSKLDVVHVSFEPWTSIAAYPPLREQYGLTGIPSIFVFGQGKPVAIYTGVATDETTDALVKEALDNVGAGRVDRFQGAKDLRSKMLLTYPFKMRIDAYHALAAHKAMAVTFDDNGNWWTGWAHSQKNQGAANKEALDNCNQSKRNRNITEPCVLFAEDANVVYEGTSASVRTTLQTDLNNVAATASRQSEEKMQQAFESFRKNKRGYKALAIAVSSTGAWQMGQIDGYLSQTKANVAALRRCEEQKAKHNIESRCQLFAVGDERVLGKSEREIENVIREMTPPVTLLDDNLKTYKGLRSHKAFALVEAEDGRWASTWVHGQPTQEQANAAALKNCGDAKRNRKVDGTCKLLFIGNEKAVTE